MTAKILIVDDEPDTLHLLTITLSRAGYNVLSAGNGRAALDLAIREQPEVIILDIMMPDMSGLDMVRTLRGQASMMPRVIFFTARSRTEDMVQGMEAGAFKYLVKPTSRDKLLETVRAALEGGESAP